VTSVAVVPQRYFEDVRAGDELTPVDFPLSVYRLVMAAGSNRDFNSIHHNTGYAQSTGAPEMYANTLFLLGMWERAVREYIGLAGTMLGIKGFRMGRFNIVGDTTRVEGLVLSAQVEDGVGQVELELTSRDSLGVTVGPGRVLASLPRRNGGSHPRRISVPVAGTR
jgi:acyl dehydratase